MHIINATTVYRNEPSNNKLLDGKLSSTFRKYRRSYLRHFSPFLSQLSLPPSPANDAIPFAQRESGQVVCA